jgi:hypothetical protein
MTTVIGGSSPSVTFPDSTVQNTAGLPLTGGTLSGPLNVPTLNAPSGVLATQNGMNGIAKAWVQFGGGITYTAGAIQGSFNVSSVTVNGTGDYSINFTTAMTNANYAANLSVSPYGQAQSNMIGQIFGYPGANFVAPTTSACRVCVTSAGYVGTPNQLNCLTVFGA